MGKFSFILASVLGLLLVGCNDNSKAQAEQIAIMQARLDEQERQNYLLQAQAQEKEEQRIREEELRKADERAQAEQNAQKTNTKANQPSQPEISTNSPKSVQPTKSETKPKPTTVKFTEKPARYPATVVTSSGYGELSLRGEPSAQGVQITTVYDGTEVLVIAETNRCETISGVRGCWHKVGVGGVKGYMFSGYLQREIISQAQKQSMYSHNNEYDDEHYGDY